MVKAIAPVQPAGDRVLQLWALPEQGSPRSLGLIPATGAASDVVRLDLPASAGLALQNIPALAVSLEPQGGSPTGLPTGPVLYSGPIQRLVSARERDAAKRHPPTKRMIPALLKR